jgi:hypothetical protein
MSLGVLLIELVATIVDRLGEEGPVRQLEGEDRCFVIRAKTLQFEHCANLPCGTSSTAGSQIVSRGRAPGSPQCWCSLHDSAMRVVARTQVVMGDWLT